MRDGGLTRRRALTLGAAAGLGAMVGRPLQALARGSRAPRGFGLRVTAADFPAGSRTSRPLRASHAFDLVGLRGARGDVEVRVRRAGGRWSRWVALAVHGDHAPDTGTGARASDPVWTGGSDELQLRVGRRRPAGDLRVHLVAVPAAARRRVRPGGAVARAAQASTPPSIIGRDQWGAAQVPPRAAPSYGDVQVAFVHHTVSANGYGPQDSAGIVLGIAKYHRDTNGWNDVGYNFLVDQYGQIFEGRAGGIDQPVIGAQAQGYNSHSTGVAILGTFQDVAPSDAALEAVARVVGWKLSVHAAPVEGQVVLTSAGGDLNRYAGGTPVTLQRISGHRDGDASSCPGDALYALLPQIRERARKYAFTPAPGASVAKATLAADTRHVAYGQQARFSGSVTRADGQPAAGEAVAVQKRGKSGAWVPVARTTVDGAGAWAASVAWKATGDVRVVAAGATTQAMKIVCLPAVAARLTARRLTAGGTVRVRGAVRPAQAVSVLVERQGSDGTWRRSQTVRGKLRGTSFDAAVRLKNPGLYRLTAKAGTPSANGAAAPLLVRAVRGRTGAAGGTSTSTPIRTPATGGVAPR